MAADLHIHVYEGLTEDDLKLFFSNTMGSKYFNPRTCEKYGKKDDDSRNRIYDTPNVWIGEVSWLKAALFRDSDTFVPSAIETIQELIRDDLPILDETLKEKILSALDADNSTSYRLARKEEVSKFLEQYMGKKLFTISW